MGSFHILALPTPRAGKCWALLPAGFATDAGGAHGTSGAWPAPGTAPNMWRGLPRAPELGNAVTAGSSNEAEQWWFFSNHICKAPIMRRDEPLRSVMLLMN